MLIAGKYAIFFLQLSAVTVTVTTYAQHQTPVCVLRDGQEVTAQKVCTTLKICSSRMLQHVYTPWVHLGRKCYASKNSAEVKSSYILNVPIQLTKSITIYNKYMFTTNAAHSSSGSVQSGVLGSEITFFYSNTDINECRVSTTCEQNCTDTDGSYSCTCNTGYSLASDLRSCLG